MLNASGYEIRHMAGAGAIGMLEAMLAAGTLAECHRKQAERIVADYAHGAALDAAPQQRAVA